MRYAYILTFCNTARRGDFGGFLQYGGGSSGVSTISLGGSVRTPLIGEIGVKADAFLLTMTSGGGTDGTALFPTGARVGLVIVI